LTEMGDRDTLARDLFANSYKRVCDQIDRGYKFVADCSLNDTLSEIEFDQIVYYKKAAGNVLASSLDYARYVDTVVWNRDDFLPADYHYEMHHGQTFYKTTDYYGYGWHMNAADPTVLWHTGGAVGGVTVVRVQLETELVTTVFCDIQTGTTGLYQMIGAAETYFGENFTFPTTTTVESTLESTVEFESTVGIESTIESTIENTVENTVESTIESTEEPDDSGSTRYRAAFGVALAVIACALF